MKKAKKQKKIIQEISLYDFNEESINHISNVTLTNILLLVSLYLDSLQKAGVRT